MLNRQYFLNADNGYHCLVLSIFKYCFHLWWSYYHVTLKNTSN